MSPDRVARSPLPPLAVARPDLLGEWSAERNPELDPWEVSAGSARRVWWRCAHGHDWEAQIAHRARDGRGCPFCRGRRCTHVESLAALRPDLAQEWHQERNGGLRPDDLGPGSRRLVWWGCQRGHEWQARVMLRARPSRGPTARGTGCPACRDESRPPWRALPPLALAHPDLAAELHPVLNAGLDPRHVSAGSRRRVWWLCPHDEAHVWEGAVATRARLGSGCPFCAGRRTTEATSLARTHPELLEQWDARRNVAIEPGQVSAGSSRRVWWRCLCGHAWRTSVAMRTLRATGCPRCVAAERNAARRGTLPT